MLKRLTHLLILLFTLQLCISDINAAQDDPCTSSGECGDGFWCKSQGTGGAICQQCNNGPYDQNNGCGTDGFPNCQYTNHSDDRNNNCPWTLTCSAGTVFVPNEQGNSGTCARCDRYYEPYPNIAYNVYWDGDMISYDNNSSTYPASCVGQLFTIQLKHGNDVIDTIYEQYDTGWFRNNDMANLIQFDQNDTVLIPSHYLPFDGYYNGNEQIFDKYGKMLQSIYGNKKTFTTDTILTARFEQSMTYDIVITDGLNNTIYSKQGCSAGSTISGCDISDIIGGCNNFNGNIIVQDHSDPNTGRISVSGNTVTFTPTQTALTNAVTDFRPGDRPVITLLGNQGWFTQCPVGSYCQSCRATQCPFGATSDSGARGVDECYFDSQTLMTDNNTTDNNPYRLPLPNNGKAYLSATLAPGN